METALRLFSERGTAAVSMRELADDAGVTVPGLYYHFASKADLIREVYRAHGSGAGPTARRPRSPIPARCSRSSSARRSASSSAWSSEREFLRLMHRYSVLGDDDASEAGQHARGVAPRALGRGARARHRPRARRRISPPPPTASPPISGACSSSTSTATRPTPSSASTTTFALPVPCRLRGRCVMADGAVLATNPNELTPYARRMTQRRRAAHRARGRVGHVPRGRSTAPSSPPRSPPRSATSVASTTTPGCSPRTCSRRSRPSRCGAASPTSTAASGSTSPA